MAMRQSHPEAIRYRQTKFTVRTRTSNFCRCMEAARVRYPVVRMTATLVATTTQAVFTLVSYVKAATSV